MAVRKIIVIDEEKCDGCGICAEACHEGAIQMIDGKAKLVSESYCDGLGDCIGPCPQDAISIVEREAAAYDEEAVKAYMAAHHEDHEDHKGHGGHAGHAGHGDHDHAACSCPSAALKDLAAPAPAAASRASSGQPSQLGHWPVQLMLVPPNAPFVKDSDLLVCADCVPFAVPDFHNSFLAGRSVVVGCPKLDDSQYYYEKLKAMFAEARPRTITVVRMEVPCCGGLGKLVTAARNEAAPDVPVEVQTLGIRGEIQRIERLAPGQTG